jgi:hypothetical protein
MKIDTTIGLKALNGEQITITEGGEVKPFSIGRLIADMLASPEDKCSFGHVKRYTMMNKFFNEKEIDIDNADLKVIEEMLEKNTTRSSVVVGQVLELLEGVRQSLKKK